MLDKFQHLSKSLSLICVVNKYCWVDGCKTGSKEK